MSTIIGSSPNRPIKIAKDPQVFGNRPNLVQNGWVGSVVIENMFSPKVPLGEKVAQLFKIWVRSQNTIFREN